jgi:hypothetical protein
MKEDILRDFFDGNASPQELKEDIEGSVESLSKTERHHIEDMSGEYNVTAKHLVSVCDKVIDGYLDPMDLHIIGFCLMSSNHFQFNTDEVDGSRVADAAIDWSDYLANYKLTIETAKKFKERLLSGTNLFTDEDHYPD